MLMNFSKNVFCFFTHLEALSRATASAGFALLRES
jgi:hypothetical protein